MRSKKFLFVSNDSLSGDLAIQLLKEGHSVRSYFKDNDSKDVYDGFIDKINDWLPYQDWADVIIFDDEFYGSFADKLRKKNKLVIGGSKYTDRLETDRDFGQVELKKNGINITPIWHFSDYDKAINFIKKNPGRYVFKPSGDAQSGNKRFVYVSHDKAGIDLAEFLLQNKNVLGKKSAKFILQKFINGVEVAVGAFFNGIDFIYPININFEHKHLFPKNLGPMTGEMGTLMFWSKKNKLFQQTLFKMRASLKKSSYVGYIDLNCIANEKGVFPLEFTSRFGYPTIQIQLSGILDKAGDWLWRLARGDKFKLSTRKGYQIGVVIATPPLLSEGDNLEEVKMYRDLSISFKNRKISKNVHIGDVKKDKKNIWRIAGSSGWCLVITGKGETVRKARTNAYKEINNIGIPHMFYRNDIGSKWTAESKKLRHWGYINS